MALSEYVQHAMSSLQILKPGWEASGLAMSRPKDATSTFEGSGPERSEKITEAHDPGPGSFAAENLAAGRDIVLRPNLEREPIGHALQTATEKELRSTGFAGNANVCNPIPVRAPLADAQLILRGGDLGLVGGAEISAGAKMHRKSDTQVKSLLVPQPLGARPAAICAACFASSSDAKKAESAVRKIRNEIVAIRVESAMWLGIG
jgi:hypothetical protein